MIVSYSVKNGLLNSHSIAIFLLAAGLCPSSHALERVTLRNGFSYDCVRNESIDSNHLRLFLAPASSQAMNQAANFIDLSSESIASVEILPDPPPPTTAPAVPAPSQDIPSLLSSAGAQHNIDAELLASIVKAESGGHANAVSHTGARGLMQLMPATARQLGLDDALRPDQNIAGGSSYLDALLSRYDPADDAHGLALALAAYNAGPAAVDRYHGIPPFRETRAYVARVLNEFKRRKLALQRSQTIAALGSH